MTSYGGLPDPDWYLDNVLVFAAPGRYDAAPAGPAPQRTQWWRTGAARARLHRRWSSRSAVTGS